MLGVFDKTGRFIKSQKGKWGFVLTVFLGTLAALSLPPYPFTPLYYIGLGLAFILMVQTERPREAFLLGLAFGFGYFGLGISWVGQSFLAQSDVPHWSAPIAVFFLVVYLSLFPAAAFMVTRKMMPQNWGARAFIFAAVFSAFEWARGIIGAIGFPWNNASSIWWPVDEMVQSVAIFGSYGLGLITLLTVVLFAPLFDDKAPNISRLGLPLAATALLGLFFLSGWIRLEGAAVTNHGEVTLRLVQANIPQLEKWDPEFLRRNFDRHVSLSTAGVAGNDGPTHIIWPETAIPYDIDNDQGLREYLAGNLGPDRTLISGATRIENGDTPRIYNSIYSLGPGGEILDVYDKVHLVPFGEYIPFRPVLGQIGLETVVAGTLDYSSGAGLKTVKLPGLPPFSPLICFEIIFSGRVVGDGPPPEWFLNVTNDAWFGNSSGPYQHYELARMRAIEQGVPVVRAAGTGISGVIDPFGRTVQKLDLGTSGFLDVQLPRALSTTTIFSNFGNYPFFILLVVFSIIGIFLRPFSRPEKKSF